MDSQGDLPSLRGTIKLSAKTLLEDAWRRAQDSINSRNQKVSKLKGYQDSEFPPTQFLGSYPAHISGAIWFDVKFYPYTKPGLDPVFAICGDYLVVICRCVLEKDRTIEILHCFQDESKAINEEHMKLNSIAWSQAENGDPLVCVAGSGTPEIKVLNVRTGRLVQTLAGHGDDILDLEISPTDPTVLASCSFDHSVRIWSLKPSHNEQPMAAICHGHGHKAQILTLSYHPKGRYLLSAGMDMKICLWAIPEDVQEHAGTDKLALIHYPHFSTTEVHTNFIDCVQWYNDLILSHAVQEDKIILWRIDQFNSNRTSTPEAPIPISKKTNSRTTVTVLAHPASNTQSAWGGRFQRLLQFDLTMINGWYVRFSLFHQIGKHPILVVGDEKSNTFFWDLHRLEEKAIGDPFATIKAHKRIEVPKYMAFSFRHFDWSGDGQWCVGVGNSGMVNVFHRWENGIPPVTTDSRP
ncbi:WD40 repeat-like protein [Pyrenochaeta sp. DS3sAY3a]|nr:WD40 repeat-like protein [Pyrenochaeta sp. DS3sAY3a]